MRRRLVGMEVAPLAAITVVAAGLRFWGLGAQSLWYDEWSTFQAIHRRLPDTLTFVADHEGAPPGYFVAAWFWTHLFGDGDGTLRALSAAAGTAVVPVAFAIVREAGRSRTAALLAAVVVAVHPFLVWYSQEARPYSLLALASSLSLLFFVRSWMRAGRRDFLLWGLLSAAAVSVHYFAAFLVVSEAIALFVLHRRRWRSLALGLVPIAVIGVGLLPTLGEQRRHTEPQSWINDFALSGRLADAGRSALTGPVTPHERLWIPMAVLALVAAYLGLQADPEHRRTVAVLAALGAASALLPLAGVAIGTDLFLGRYLIAALIPLLIAAAVGLASPAARLIGPAVVAVFGVASLVTLAQVAQTPAQHRPPWREVAEAFEDDGGAPAGRAALVIDRYGRLAMPLDHYVSDDVRPLDGNEEARVTTIDIVELRPSNSPCNLFVGSACGFLFIGNRLPPELDGLFHLEAQRDAGAFRINRYRAETPVRLSKETIVPFVADRALVLIRP